MLGLEIRFLLQKAMEGRTSRFSLFVLELPRWDSVPESSRLPFQEPGAIGFLGETLATREQVPHLALRAEERTSRKLIKS